MRLAQSRATAAPREKHWATRPVQQPQKAEAAQVTALAERLLGDREPRQCIPGLTPAAQAGGQVGRPRKLRTPAQGSPTRRALVTTQPRTGRAWKQQRRPQLERGDDGAPTSPANTEKGARAAQSHREREEQKAESYQQEERTAKHHGSTFERYTAR